MNNKLMIGIVLGFFVIAIAAILLRGPLFVTPTRSMNVLTNLTTTSDTKELMSIIATDAILSNSLQNNGPYTFFAPTDEAFNRLPAETVAELKNPDNDQLRSDLLTGHQVIGSYRSSDLYDGRVLTTVSGKKLAFSQKDGKLYINKAAKVVTSDIVSKNGVIHTINVVFIP